MPRPNNTIDTILAKTDRKENGCWIWTGRVNHKGYGQVSWNGKERKAHRVVFEHFNGPLAEGLQVCHRCDTPPCINPDHLFSGTQLDNEHDKIDKGRHRNRWTGKLPENLVAGLGFEPRTSGL